MDNFCLNVNKTTEKQEGETERDHTNNKYNGKKII